MSGLIWAGIGKGLADAGSTFGQYMLRDIEDRRRQEAEDRREALAMKRLEEADRIKSERETAREEALQQRVIKDTAAARARGEEIGRARESAAYDKLAESSARAGEEGDIALTKEQLRDLPPELKRQYQSMGLINEKLPLTADQRRLQAAQDDLTGAMEMGAHSSVIKGFQEIRKGVLDEIREENRDARERARDTRLEAEGRRRDERFEASEARREREFKAMMPVKKQQADAATTRAERPSAAGGGANKPTTVHSTITQGGQVIAVMRDGTTRPLNISSDQFNTTVANLVTKMAKDNSSFSRLPEEEKRRQAIERLAGSVSAAPSAASAPSNNAGASSAARPALGSFLRQ